VKTRVLPMGVALGDDPDEISADYGTTALSGEPYALLRIGPRLGLHIDGATPAVLRKLAAAATELADWQESQNNQEGQAA
jgi:hypothetical protein